MHRHENVHIIVPNERLADHVAYQLGYFAIGLENVDFCVIPTDDVWVRDSLLTDAAHSNYLVANGVVLVPVFGNANDETAKAIIGEQFPGREVVGIDSVAIVENGGAIHCVTQQQPAV